jgi:8-oxo-dGTP pyrophosphatase MutT (NUDIX family)
VDANESLEAALFREVQEEVGLEAKHYNVVAQRGVYRYLYPPNVQRKNSASTGTTAKNKPIFSAT